MIIVHDRQDILDASGKVIASVTHFLDTADPQVVTMLKNLNGNPSAQELAGYSLASGVQAGATRWQVIVAAANAPAADSSVKALLLK
jgi:hypothetical protein